MRVLAKGSQELARPRNRTASGQLLAAVTTLAAVMLARRPASGQPPLRAWPVAVMLASAAALTVFPLVISATTTVTTSHGAVVTSNPWYPTQELARYGLAGALAIGALAAVIQVAARARHAGRGAPQRGAAAG